MVDSELGVIIPIPTFPIDGICFFALDLDRETWIHRIKSRNGRELFWKFRLAVRLEKKKADENQTTSDSSFLPKKSSMTGCLLNLGAI